MQPALPCDHLAARGGVTYRDEAGAQLPRLRGDGQVARLRLLAVPANRGVLMAPGAEENWTLSVQHSSDDVKRYVANFRELARDLKA